MVSTRNIIFYHPDIGETKLDNAVFSNKFVFLPYSKRDYFIFLEFDSVRMDNGELLFNNSQIISCNGKEQLFTYKTRISNKVFLSFIFHVNSTSEIKTIVSGISKAVGDRPGNFNSIDKRIGYTIQKICNFAPLYCLVDMNHCDNSMFQNQIVNSLSSNMEGQIFVLLKKSACGNDESDKIIFSLKGKTTFSSPLFILDAAFVFLSTWIACALSSLSNLFLLLLLFVFLVIYILPFRIHSFERKIARILKAEPSSIPQASIESFFGVGTGAFFAYFLFANQLTGFYSAYFILLCFLTLFSSMVGSARINSTLDNHQNNFGKMIKKTYRRDKQ